jgi:3-phenylpropionate/cinnamic acid dioxygenase small subunit
MRADDYAAVQQLFARYCHIVDTKSWDDLLDVFTADAAVTVQGIHDETTGIDAVRDLYAVRMRHPLAHNSTCVVVEAETDSTARVVSKWITIRADGRTGAGVYHDQLVHTDRGWRIRERVAVPLLGAPQDR